MQKNTEITVDRAAIATRAYELFMARGRQPGHDVEDWLRAEAELRRAQTVINAVAGISSFPPPPVETGVSLFPPPAADEAPRKPTRRRTRKA